MQRLQMRPVGQKNGETIQQKLNQHIQKLSSKLKAITNITNVT